MAGSPGAAAGDSAAASAVAPQPSALVSIADAMKNGGLKNPQVSMENDQNTKETTSSTQKTGMAPGLFTRAMGEVNANDQPAQDALSQLSAIAKARAAAQPDGRPLDLTGLMMAADFANKTDQFGKSYAQKRAQDMQAQENKEKQGQQGFADEANATKDVVANAKNNQVAAGNIAGGGSMGSVGQMMNNQKVIEAAGKSANPQKQYSDWSNALRGDKTLNDAQGQIQNIKQAQALINQNTSPANLLQNISTLRASGLNRLNQYELSQFGGDQSLVDRLSAAVQKLSTGQNTPQNIAEYQNVLNTMKQRASDVQTQRTQFFREDGAQRGLDSSQVEPMLQTLYTPHNYNAPHVANRGSTGPAPGAPPTASRWGAPPAPPTSNAPHGPSVIQNGHTFNWNPATRKYE